MLIKNVIFICAITLLVAGCSDEASETPEKMDALMSKKFTYVVDPNTGLCFARFINEGTKYTGFVYTHVPCTDKVNALLFTNSK